MATAVKVPQLGLTMTEARLVRWLKALGDAVRQGEPVAEIETDKLSADVEALGEGVLRRIVVPEGASAPVAGLLAVIAAPDEPESAIEALLRDAAAASPSLAPRRAAAVAPMKVDAASARAVERLGQQRAAPAAPMNAGAAAPSARHPQVAGIVAPPTAGAGETLRATPLARRRAADLQVDLAGIAGSGPRGRITEADVRANASRPSPGVRSRSDSDGVEHRAFPDRLQSTVAPATTSSDAGQQAFVRASPFARRLAREYGLELASLRGSGPEGRVLERDLLAAVTATLSGQPAAIPEPASVPPRRETIKMDGMRRLIGERMLRSLRESAQLTLTTEADATALVALRAHLLPAARVYGHRPPSYTDMLLYLLARTLRQHPLLNSSMLGEGDQQEIACWADINVGVAVALERGLVVPVLRQADEKSLDAISAELGDFVDRARANALSLDDVQGGTITITNLGALEIDGFTPILNPPQCAILGIGRIARKPAVVQEQIVPRDMVTLSLTVDHRVIDGAPAAALLRDLKRAIEGVGETGWP